MNCFNHHQVLAVAQCQDCTKGFCKSCAMIYSIPICDACYLNRVRHEKTKIILELILTYGLGLALTLSTIKLFKLSGKDINTVSIFSIFYVYSGIVAGWKTLNKMTPTIFLFLPLIGWLLFFIIKLFISMYIGLVMLPLRTIKNIIRFIKII